MNFNTKVDELIKIAAALKDEVGEMNNDDLNEQLEQLEWEKEALKNDIIELRKALMEQQQMILSLIQEQNDKLVETIETEKLMAHTRFNKTVTDHVKKFPIKSVEELEEVEAFISDSNINELVAIVQQLLTPRGIVKNIESVLSMECIIQCNLDGIHNKKRLLNYSKFMNLLFQAAYYDGYTKKTFLEEVRRSLKLVKNRHNKNTFRNRQQQRLQQSYEEEQPSDLEDIKEFEILNDDLKKEEEIFFLIRNEN